MAIAVGHPMAAPPSLAPLARELRGPSLRLYYYEAGDGPQLPLLLLHGLGDDADSWRRVLPALAARRRVLAPDLPGFGRSDKPRRAYTSAFFARVIAGMLDALGVERVALIGSSLGAGVAQRLALLQPGRVGQLVLIDGGLRTRATLPPRPLWPFLTPLLGERAYASLRASQDAAYATLAPYYASLEGLPAEDRAFLRERVWDDGQRGAFLSALRCLSLERVLLAPVFRRRLARLAVPTALIWGDRDRIVDRAEGEALAALLPAAAFHLIGDCGHLPQQERPAQLLALLEQILI
jgi:pimeloyl-ACP methyl ester carboxylesterase